MRSHEFIFLNVDLISEPMQAKPTKPNQLDSISTILHHTPSVRLDRWCLTLEVIHAPQSYRIACTSFRVSLASSEDLPPCCETPAASSYPVMALGAASCSQPPKIPSGLLRGFLTVVKDRKLYMFVTWKSAQEPGMTYSNCDILPQKGQPQ